jgi:protein TonB
MSRGRDVAGWIGAGAVAAGLFAGATAAALRAPPTPWGAAAVEVVALDMSVGVVAMAEVLPSEPPVQQPLQQIVHTKAPPAPVLDAAPRLPLLDPAPVLEPVAMPQITPEASPMLPVAEVPPMVTPPPAEVQEEEPLDLAQSPRPRLRPEAKPSEEPKAPVEQAKAEPKAEETPRALEEAQTSAAQAAGVQQAAQPAQKRREAGGREAARYGDVVMRQIARSPRARAPERGVVTVGFEIKADGGLLRVAVVVSSGSTALDQVAVDHIRRAAPFPPPPEGAMVRFAFEFVGK